MDDIVDMMCILIWMTFIAILVWVLIDVFEKSFHILTPVVSKIIVCKNCKTNKALDDGFELCKTCKEDPGWWTV